MTKSGSSKPAMLAPAIDERPKANLPGPAGLPCIGSMLDYKGPRTNLEWTRKYGDIYHVKMVGRNLVYLNSLSLVKEYLEGKKGDAFLDRPMGPAAIGEGLLFGSGENWQKNKRAMMKALHTETFKTQLENVILSELHGVLESFFSFCGQKRAIVKPGDVLLQACANTIAGLLCGGNLPQGSKDRKNLAKVAQDLQGSDLSSMLSQISLKHPKLREPLSKLLFTEIVDAHGMSRRLQRLLRQWIRQARSGTLTPTPTNPKPLPNFKSSRPPKLHRSTNVDSDEDSGIHTKCPRLQSSSDIYDTVSTSDFSSEATSESGFSEGSELFSSQESILVGPKDDHFINQAMKNISQLATLGFTDTAHGEMPYEPCEPCEPPQPIASPNTPLVQNQWNFQKQMSINPGQDSILQRLLKQPEYSLVTEENDAELLQGLIDMFFGGITSTLSAIEFTLYHLTHNPMMQEMARKEIDQTLAKVGSEDTITWEMHAQMPYLRACITEGLRLGAVTPSSLPHVATKETEIEGFPISAGTMVLASIISLHRDPKFYIDPDTFRPQRHIGTKGDYQTPESYRPYGIGARRCVGDQMSEMQIFILTANILRRFYLKPTGSTKFDSQDTHMRIIHRLKDFRCVMEARSIE